MFHMMAGTSTGGIVTAALSLPDKQNIRLPRYRAVDIVELYTTRSNEVFSRRHSDEVFFGVHIYERRTTDVVRALFWNCAFISHAD